MKKIVLLLVVALAAGAAIWWPTSAQDKDEAGVRKALEYYLQGHATGDGENHKKAFHPEAKLFWIRDGKFAERTSADYIAGAPGKPAADEAQRKRSIEMIDITGNAAVAKIVLDYPNAKLTDYMSLLKVDGEWKIVNKIFMVEPKTKP
ncbi:MAG TPA: nuclear transport factor 2 family protein [Pyrinomonadaceae bacterium]|nr:nuclear transport factor 2 family protein [Pyrinomonadaceae bacterium]